MRARYAVMAGAWLLWGAAAPALGQEAPPDTAQAGEGAPLHISADNVTGTHGPEGDTVLLKGNVRIVRGRTVITSNSGRYTRSQGMLFLDDHVKMVDSTTIVTSDHVSYSELDDRLQLFGNVVIRDGDSELRAPSGTYDRRTGRADLFGGVWGTQDQQELTCDRAIYWRDSMVVQSRGNVRATDRENKLELLAESVDFDRDSHEAFATGKPALNSTDDKGKITRLTARALKLNTETRFAEAIDSVRVVRDSLAASASYAAFDDEAQRGILLGNPRVWDDQTIVTGDTMEVLTERRVVKRVIVRSNAVMDYVGSRPKTLGEATRLTGERVDVFFTDNDIDSLVATGNARNDYQAPPREGLTAERNLALGDTITIFFKDRKVESARFEGEASGTYRMAVASGDTVAAEREVVRYKARRLEFQVPKSKIILDGRSHLEYRDMVLEARRVEFDVDDETLVANGSPQLMDRGDRVTGHLMTYDLNSRVGTIYQAETAYERGLYHGERIRKVDENELDVMHGSYSTCDLDDPHYHFGARWMKIFLKDKLVAKPVVFYVRDVPLLALPFWVFPIKPGRHSGFLFPQFELGFNNRTGQFIRNAGYYWAPNDYMDLTFTGDYYRAEPSWVLRTEGRYKLLYLLDGDMRATFARNERLKRDDWDFTANHQQTIDPNTRLVARGSFVSSRDFNSSDQYGRPLAQRLNRFLTSSISLSRTTDWASINAIIDRRQDLDADETLKNPLNPLPVGTTASLSNLTQNEPNLSVSLPTRQIGGLPLLRGSPLQRPLSTMYLSLGAQFLSLRQQNGFVERYDPISATESTAVIGQRVEVRRALASNVSLSDNRRVLGWLNLSPRFNANVYVFDHDVLGNEVVPTGTWSGSVTTSSTFYGTFLPRWGVLEGVRHVVFPRVSYSFSPEFPHLTYVDSVGNVRQRFEGFGGIGVSGFKRSVMSFGLDQRLQAKLRRGTETQRLDNLVSWSLSGGYDFLKTVRPMTFIGSQIRVQPPRLINATLGWTMDPYDRRKPVRAMNLNMGLNVSSSGWGGGQDPSIPLESQRGPEGQPPPAWFRDAWALGLTFSHSGGYVGNAWNTRQSANAVAHYQLSPAWTIDWSAHYDVTQRQLQTQRFSLTRDLHCWNMTFTRTFVASGEAEYYFRIGIKEQSEIFVERGTRAGSIGGIN